jgi:hypothetical protein
MKKVKELEQLEAELNQLLDNVKRVKEFQKKQEHSIWVQDSSVIFGELKHRLTAFKCTCTRLSKLSTRNLFK